MSVTIDKLSWEFEGLGLVSEKIPYLKETAYFVVVG